MKKIILSVLTSLVFLFSFAPFAYAQSQSGTWYDQSFQEWYSKVYDNNNPSEIFGERYTAAQVQWVFYGLFAFALKSSGVDPKTTACLMNNDIKDCVDRLKDLFVAPKNQSTSDNQQSILGYIFAQDRPLSGITYTKNVLRKFSLIPEAQAQTPGFGFGALDPILPLWRAIRNISYALFVLMVLILAFMIMFRVKISPQVVISVQSAIPKVAIALILVTFSYAIAGFLVDLMYVVIGLVSLFVSQSIQMLGWATAPTSTMVFGFLTRGPFGFGIVGLIGFYFLFFFISATFGLMGINGLGGLFSGSLIFGGILGILLTIIVAVVLLFIAIKIIWMLFKTFATLLLLVIVSPFQIVLGIVVPGLGFGSWLKSFLSNLAVFPITGLLFSLAYVFLFMVVRTIFGDILSTLAGAGDFWKGFGLGIPVVNTLVAASGNQGWPPLLVLAIKNPLAIIYLGVSLVIVFIIPKTVDIIKAMIEGKPFAFGTAIGEVTAPVRWAAGTPAGRAIQEYGGLSTGYTILSEINKATGLFGKETAAMRQRLGQSEAARSELKSPSSGPR